VTDPKTAPTHRPARITELTFANALLEGPHVFKGMGEIGAIWATLAMYGVDASFALGQFYAESFFGNAGYAKDAADDGTPLHAIGNILSVNSPLLDRDEPGVATWSNHAHTYTYARYSTWALGALDYCLLLRNYAMGFDPRYGDSSMIFGATARWAGKAPGSIEHRAYMDAIVGRMDTYDGRPPWEGDMAIIAPVDTVPSSNARYQIRMGDRWFEKAGGHVSHAFTADMLIPFFGLVGGTSWFAVGVRTGRFSTDGSLRSAEVYLPAYDPTRHRIP
jgi:hypothetical protein